MSLRALVEIVVNLDSFRNIDLFYQGVYFVKLRLFYKRQRQFNDSPGTNEQVELAYPYCHFQSHVMEQRADKMSALGQRDPQSMMPSRINDAEMSFVSKAFLLRYCEEEIEIGDTVMFRSELDVEPDYLMTDYFLESELYFSDLVTAGGPEYWQTADIMKVKFKKV